MEHDFKKELSNFQQVWQRVCKSRGKTPDGLKLMPGKSRKKTCHRGGYGRWR